MKFNRDRKRHVKTSSLCWLVCLLGWCMPLLNGCGKSVTEEQVIALPDYQPMVSMNQAQEQQKKQALAARDQLFSMLMGELTSSMTENGPVESIRVCKTRAPEIATQVSQETGVRIGRTSFKLRSQNNAAPEWAATFVDQRVENEIAVELADNRLGMLLPIRLKATCIMCHGSDEAILPEVKAAIISAYPADEATGFAEGDLRGYFWIEVSDSEASK